MLTTKLRRHRPNQITTTQMFHFLQQKVSLTSEVFSCDKINLSGMFRNTQQVAVCHVVIMRTATKDK